MLFAALAAGCSGGEGATTATDPPRHPATVETRAQAVGAARLQDRPPIDALNAYLNGFHFYNGQPGAQMEAHHYCAHLNEEVIQCVIYDGSARSAKLVGIEYIVSARLFAQLPAEEKALWHSHVHEVKSGQLVAPGIPEVVERRLMKHLVGTYGKTWHTWHTSHSAHTSDSSHTSNTSHRSDRSPAQAANALPLGVPQLMMGFTADGQADAAMVARRDERLGIASGERRQQRAGIAAPAVDAGADAWQKGNVFQPEGPAAARGRPLRAPVP